MGNGNDSTTHHFHGVSFDAPTGRKGGITIGIGKDTHHFAVTYGAGATAAQARNNLRAFKAAIETLLGAMEWLEC